MKDDKTLFFGPRRYIQNLWAVFDSQKAYIYQLERQLTRAGIQPMQPLQQKEQNQQQVISSVCTVKYIVPSPDVEIPG